MLNGGIDIAHCSVCLQVNTGDFHFLITSRLLFRLIHFFAPIVEKYESKQYAKNVQVYCR